MTPTPRAAAILAVIAVAALAIPAWVVVAATLALLAAVAADAWTVRRAPSLRREVPTVLSRGVETTMSARASPTDGRRVLLRQPAAPGVTVLRDTGGGELSPVLVGERRGRVSLPGIASASIGPLGLARVHHRALTPVELAVYPDLLSARRLILRLRRTLAGLAGGLARGPIGLGPEFESVRDYSPDDDIRQLNWLATARLGRPMSNQYRVERDRDVLCLVDCGRLTSAPLGERTVLDTSLDALTVIALAADELGDRFGAVAFDDGIRRSVAPRHRGGRPAIDALFDLTSVPLDSDFERAFAHLSRLRRALVFVHTDLIDETAARSLVAGMVVLARRHSVIVTGAADPELRGLADNGQEPARALAALDVLATRRQAALALRQAGARVLEAPPAQLAERCLTIYVSAKLRGSW